MSDIEFQIWQDFIEENGYEPTPEEFEEAKWRHYECLIP